MEKLYMHKDTGFFWTEEEIKEEYEKQKDDEGILSFDEVMDSMEEINIDWFIENSNNGVLTDGEYFYVDLGSGEGSAIKIIETKYAHLLNGTEEEFQDGIMYIDNDLYLWQQLLDLYIEEKGKNGYL